MAFFNKKSSTPDTSKPPVAGDGAPYFQALNQTNGRISALNVGVVQDNVKSTSMYYMSNDYFSLLAESHYWCGLWKPTTSNESINQGMQLFLNQLFLAGTAGWYYDTLQEEFIPIAITKYELDKTGKFEKGIGYNLYQNLGLQYAGDATKYKGDKLELTKDNAGLFFYNVWLFGAWVLWYPFVKNRNMLINQLISASPILTKKLVYAVANKNTTDAELKSFIDPLQFYLTQFKNANDKDFTGTNRYEVLSPKGDISLEEARKHLDYYLEYNYRYLGRRINLNDKQERNVNSEVQYSQSNFDMLENVWLTNLNNCAKLMSKSVPTFNLEFNVVDISNDTAKNYKEGDENGNETSIDTKGI